jgi:hypothetical protein
MTNLQDFLGFLTELKAKANLTLQGLPPLEQFEASSELAYCFRALQRQANELVEFTETINKSMTEVAAKLGAEAVAEAVTAGNYIAKTDHEAALSAARIAVEKDVRNTITAEQVGRDKVASRRQQIITDKILPAVAAERLSDTVLGADDYLGSAAKVGSRIKLFGDLGVTAETAGEVIAEVASIPLDADGEAIFTQRLQFVTAAATASKKMPVVPAPVVPINPLMPGAGGVPAETAGFRRNLL